MVNAAADKGKPRAPPQPVLIRMDLESLSRRMNAIERKIQDVRVSPTAQTKMVCRPCGSAHRCAIIHIGCMYSMGITILDFYFTIVTILNRFAFRPAFLF
jgi:hypothetical protein